MRVVVIGSTGHIGTHPVPRLWGAGHEVPVVARETRDPYQPASARAAAKRIELDREREE